MGSRWHRALQKLPRLLLHISLLVFLVGLCWTQLKDYWAEPVSVSQVREVAPFPRITVCPVAAPGGNTTIDDYISIDNGSSNAEEYYARNTLLMPERYVEYSLEYRLKLRGLDASRTKTIAYVGGKYSAEGGFRQRYYLQALGAMTPIRCATFEPGPDLQSRAKLPLSTHLRLQVHPLFSAIDGVALHLTKNTDLFNSGYPPSYRIFLHAGEPNVQDLTPFEVDRGTAIRLSQNLESVYLKVHAGKFYSYRITAKLHKRINLRRRPCRDDPDYSQTACLKQCLWRRQTAVTGCRLPHMTLSEDDQKKDPLRDLPMCRQLLQRRSLEIRHFFVYPRPWMRECPEVYDNFLYSPSPLCLTEPFRHMTPDQFSLNRRMNYTSERFFDDAFLLNTSGCSCPPNCQEVEYSLQDESLQLAVDQKIPTTGCNCTSMVLLLMDLVTEETRETLSLSLPTLLANVGGYMGLLLGYSLLSLTEIGAAVLSKIMTRFAPADRAPPQDRVFELSSRLNKVDSVVSP